MKQNIITSFLLFILTLFIFLLIFLWKIVGFENKVRTVCSGIGSFIAISKFTGSLLNIRNDSLHRRKRSQNFDLRIAITFLFKSDFVGVVFSLVARRWVRPPVRWRFLCHRFSLALAVCGSYAIFLFRSGVLIRWDCFSVRLRCNSWGHLCGLGNLVFYQFQILRRGFGAGGLWAPRLLRLLSVLRRRFYCCSYSVYCCHHCFLWGFCAWPFLLCSA